jgi:hypothetical protein
MSEQPLDAPRGDHESVKLHPRAAGLAFFAIDAE